jgi:predicted MFS family arabinose efflux permease
LLFAAMAAATFSISAISIVASSIIDDLGISREQLGLVATINIVIAALLSPRGGEVIDRIGGRKGFVAIFLFGGAAFAVMSSAVAYWILLAGSVVAAVSQAAGNPATNKLIALYLPPGRRGVVTGIKQSGVQAASFVGGILLPVGAVTIGWRATFLVAAAFTLAAIIPALRVVPVDRPDAAAHSARKAPLAASVWWLAVYGALLGFGGASTFFVPLFAEEALGYGPQGAGLAAAIIGLVAFVGRIAWARFAERGARFVWSLGAIAALAVVSGLVFLASTSTPALVWLAVVVVGTSSGSWNSVGMLAVIHEAGAERAGRASGRVMFGFLVGLGIAPPLFGRTIDVTGSYDAMWSMATAAFALAMLLVAAWSRSVAARMGTDVASGDGSGGTE